MPTEATFRFSTYLTLALACVALGYAQAPMLPEVAVFAALAVVALGALYFAETRFALLAIPAANRLGAGVGVAFLAWAAFRIKLELEEPTTANMGWNTMLVGLCGPLVMLVLAAKVARGEKHAGDYWTLHGTALAGVGLAAAFADEPLCFALVGLYLVTAVWSLALFYLHRASGIVPPVPDPKVMSPRAAFASAERYGARAGLAPAVAWAVAAGAVAVPLYLLTPRSQAQKADFGKPRVEIGYAADQMVDLTRTGTLRANDETAFEVSATGPDGAPKTDLPPDQRWRGSVRRSYSGGTWKVSEGPLPSLTRTAAQPAPWDVWSAPDLGPGQFTLTFTTPPRTPAYFLADPVAWRPDQPPPVAAATAAGPRGWMPSPDGTFYWEQAVEERGRPAQYLQAYNRGAVPDLGPGFQLFAGGVLGHARGQLTGTPPARVKEYADKLLDDLIASGQLPAEWRDPAVLRDWRRRVREEHHDRLARAFAEHLAGDRTFTYTSELRRVDSKVDPIEDFLFNSRAGHCERFATALTLMLWSQDVPAVFVLGFKGCEHTGAGKYVVKQEHAHAWVEALVSVPVPADERAAGGPERMYHWRSLDPTPGGGDDGTGGGNLWLQSNAWLETQFRRYAIDYTAEQRKATLGSLADLLSRPEALFAAVAVAAVLSALRVMRRRRAGRSPEACRSGAPTRWFGELLAALGAHGLVPAPGQTLLEFAQTAEAVLRTRPACEPLAAVPIAWAETYYQDRFGGIAPSDARLAELQGDLARLRTALETRA
ncbi:MAG: transglutaminase-like domain-containing protein [Gemmata sp.]